MDIIVLNKFSDKDRKSWDDYVEVNPGSTFFHLIGWKNSVELCFRHTPYYLMAAENGRCRGILPLFLVKSILFGSALVSVPFAVYGGVCADDFRVEAKLVEESKELARRLGVGYLELRHIKCNGHNLPVKNLYATFRKEIFENEDQNMAAIPRKQRRMIRVGMKNGLRSKVGRTENLREFYDIYAHSYRNLGTPVYPYSLLENMFEEFGEACKLLSVWNEGRMVAGVVTFLFKDTVIPYYGGAYRDSYSHAVNDFMYWELMKYGCARGYKVFDFGRSKKGTGAYDFKRHWGIEPEPLAYQYYLVKRRSVPNLSPVNPKYRPFIATWRRLPLPLTKAIGPRIVKYIP